MAEKLTMMAVHAHPDDEASSTGGVLAAYSAQGIQTVVVTCTNGEFGDAPGGVKPGQNGHDEKEVARQRLAELRESCAILGVTDLELLGYHDSGMPDWDYKDRPDAFCNVPEADVAARISGLIERYRPQVLITYDDQGPYQHPDHVHASRCAQAAVGDQRSVAKLYLSAMRGSDWRKIWEALRELGAEVPDFEEMDPERQRQALASEQRITTTVDIRSVLGRKRDALFAHGSQIADRGSARSRRTSPSSPSAVSTSSGSATPPALRYPRTTCSPACGHDRAEGRGTAEDAAGLVERSAAAYASAVPVRPEDDGFFGPASVTWRVSADLSAPVAGLRSLLLQALHPLAMAASTSTATGGAIRSAGSRPPRPTRSRSRSGTGAAPGGSPSGCGPSTPMSAAWTR